MESKKSKTKKRTTESDTWTVRGVSQSTRSAVRIASRKAGKPMGQWIEETLIHAAVDQSSHTRGLSSNGTENLHKDFTARHRGRRFSDRVEA